jgi:hypothetical protein
MMVNKIARMFSRTLEVWYRYYIVNLGTVRTGCTVVTLRNLSNRPEDSGGSSENFRDSGLLRAGFGELFPVRGLAHNATQ